MSKKAYTAVRHFEGEGRYGSLPASLWKSCLNGNRDLLRARLRHPYSMNVASPSVMDVSYGTWQPVVISIILGPFIRQTGPHPPSHYGPRYSPTIEDWNFLTESGSDKGTPWSFLKVPPGLTVIQGCLSGWVPTKRVAIKDCMMGQALGFRGGRAQLTQTHPCNFTTQSRAFITTGVAANPGGLSYLHKSARTITSICKSVQSVHTGHSRSATWTSSKEGSVHHAEANSGQFLLFPQVRAWSLVFPLVVGELGETVKGVRDFPRRGGRSPVIPI